MVLAEPELLARGRVFLNNIVVEATGSELKVVSAEAYTKHGVNAHGVIIDELHAQPNRELVDVLTTSTGARRQPLIIYITTADFDRESICNEKYDYACKVRDGIIADPAFLPVIYEAQRDDDWTSPAVWARANPNLGVSVSREYLERECRRAQETPTYENTFKRLHLNLRTQQDVRWLSIEAWDACGDEPVDESALDGQACFAGLDLSTTTDVSALALVFPDSDGTVAVVSRFWIPGDNAEKRERRDRVPYQTWCRQGLIDMTPGNVIDYERIRSAINELGGNRPEICRRHYAALIPGQMQNTVEFDRRSRSPRLRLAVRYAPSRRVAGMGAALPDVETGRARQLTMKRGRAGAPVLDVELAPEDSSASP